MATTVHTTNPSSKPGAKQRRLFAKTGVAMPNGSYFIRPGHPEDIDNAIATVGYAKDEKGQLSESQRNAVRRHIMKRAKALKMEAKIPATWNADGSLKQTAQHSDDFDEFLEFLEHHGIKGMHWGVHRKKKESLPSSDDSVRVKGLQERAKKSNTANLSNAELQALVTRMNLESQYKNLNKKERSIGERFVDDLTKDAANEVQREIFNQAKRNAPKLISLVSKAISEM